MGYLIIFESLSGRQVRACMGHDGAAVCTQLNRACGGFIKEENTMAERIEHADMPYRVLGRTGEQVSAIGLGGWHLGFKRVDEHLSLRIVREALDRGTSSIHCACEFTCHVMGPHVPLWRCARVQRDVAHAARIDTAKTRAL